MEGLLATRCIREFLLLSLISLVRPQPFSKTMNITLEAAPSVQLVYDITLAIELLCDTPICWPSL